MVATHPLDAIIQRASSRHKPDKRSESEALVIVDCNKKEALDRRPLWGEVKYFLVRNTHAGQDPAECEPPPFIVKDIEGDREVIIKLKCWVSCSPGNEKRVAVALCDPVDRPSAAFERLLRRWTDEFVKPGPGRAEFIDGYFDESQRRRERLQEHLQSKALFEAGLNLQVKVWLEGEPGSHKPVEVSTGKFLVSVSDYSERQELEVACELELDERHKINAVVRYKRTGQLRDKVIGVVTKYFARRVSLDQFYSELNSPGLLDGLTRELDDALVAEGRRVGRIFLKSGGGQGDEQSPPQFGPHEVGVKVSVQEYPEQVEIGNKLLLSRRALSLHKARGCPPLDAWVKEKLERIIRDVLFDAKYIDLLLDFDGRKAEIEAKLRAEAATIGYEVKQLITAPALDPLKWLDPFLLKVDETFETRRPKFFVKLSIVVAARFETLDELKIRSALNRRQSVPALMHEEIRKVASQYLHGIEPEQFYTAFYYDTENKYPGQKPVEAALRDGITDALREKFGADIIEVIPKMDDTDVIINLMILQEKPCDFSIQVTPLDGGAPVLFRGKFLVDGVDPDGWHTFLSRKFTIEDVKQHLEDDVRAKLKTRSEGELLYKRLGDLKAMEDDIGEMAALSIKKMFGLLVRVSAVDRDFTIVEKKMSDEVVERHISRIRLAEQRRLSGEDADTYEMRQLTEGIKELADERRRLGPDAPAEQLQEFEERIQKEREKLRPDGISPLEDVERILRPKLPGPDRLKPAELTEAMADPLGGGSNEEGR